ncbi:MAG: ABC transporter permease, partial [Spirochaetota bacterium]
MNFEEGLRQSFEVIAGNKLRSLLTMLGIIFGVGCLIAISIVGGAFRGAISGEMGQYGSTLVWVQANWEAYARGERRTYLDDDDVRFMRSSLPGIEYSGTMLDVQETVSYEGASRLTRVYGVSPDHFVIFANSIARGRSFTENDVRAMSRVCVLRPDVAQAVFQGDDPIGKRVRVGSEVYTVVGVTEPLENPLLGDGSNNDTVFVPWELVSRRVFGGGPPVYFVYFFRFESLEQVDFAVDRMAAYLENRYGRLRDVPRFRIDTSDQYIG